jgi:oligopeptide transport system substrate-binding protein
LPVYPGCIGGSSIGFAKKGARRVEDPKSNSKYADELYPIMNAEAVNTGKLDVTALGVAAPDEQTV